MSVRDWSALQDMLVADPLAATETIQSRTSYPPLIIDSTRYYVASLIFAHAEAGNLNSTLEQALPRLKRWVRDWEQQVSSDFSHALVIAIQHTGHGTACEPLSDYVASKPLTAKEQQVLAEFIRMSPEAMPRGQRGKRRLPRSEEAQAEIQLARETMEWQEVYRQQNPTKSGLPRKNVRVRETKAHLKERVKVHQLWQNASEFKRELVVENILGVLKTKDRL